MSTIPAPLLSGSVTFLIVFFYFFTAFQVGNLRGKHGIKAPATAGHPAFDRAYRVQLNTLEQMGIILPLLWLATYFPIHPAWLAPLVALIWLVGRVIYRSLYLADPERRLPGAFMTGLCDLAMAIIALVGLANAWSAAHIA